MPFFLGGGKSLVNAYYNTAEDLGVTVAYEAPVKNIVIDDNAFRAVMVEIDGQIQTIESWADFQIHVGARKKSAPAFDAIDLSSGENNLFGVGTTEARHFTTYGLRLATGDGAAELDPNWTR